MTRAWIPTAMLAVGLGLLASAGYARPVGKHPFKQGGTLRVNFPGSDIDDIDPSLAYASVSWHIEYSTALKLLNYPDAPSPRGSRLVPEGASSFSVSRDGTTYTFTIRKGFRFSSGQKVTARNYAYALNRVMDRNLQSPGFQFISDPRATNIVGAQDVRDGRVLEASGVRVRGNKLIIELTKPDGTFLSKLSMPFFQALPLSLPRDQRILTVDAGHPLPAAGPYYVSERDYQNRIVIMRRNPFYRGKRPRRLSEIDIRTQRNLAASYQEVRANEADYSIELPQSAPSELAREFGLNGRFRVRPASCVSYIAMNTRSPLFANNAQLRRAVNYAIDRRAMTDLYGARGYLRLRTDQYLPRGFPGFKDIDAYPFEGDLAKARSLAAGHVPSGGPWVYYHGQTPPGPQLMELVRSALSEIGIAIEPRRIPWGFGFDYRRPDWAFLTTGWCGDYPDPFDFINQLNGASLREEVSYNYSNFDDPVYNRRMDRAAKLIGAPRLRAYQALDRDLATKAAPWAAWGQPAHPFFFSDNVDQRTFLYQPIYESAPYNVLALK